MEEKTLVQKILEELNIISKKVSGDDEFTFIDPEEFRKAFRNLKKKSIIQDILSRDQYSKFFDNKYREFILLFIIQLLLYFFYILGGYYFIMFILIPCLNIKSEIKMDIIRSMRFVNFQDKSDEEVHYLQKKLKEKKYKLILFNSLSILLTILVALVYPILIYKYNDSLFYFIFENIVKLGQFVINSLSNSSFILFINDLLLRYT